MANDIEIAIGHLQRSIAEVDPEIADAIRREAQRQASGLELIASENFVSEAVLEAAGSVFTNKYAEGYPGKRYYGGCEYVDVVESLAIERAKALFGAEHANVQPHSGSQANQAVYLALLEPGDTVLGLDLAHGGHLTHGMKLNISGKLYKFLSYGVRQDDHRLDFDQVAKLAREHKPRLIVAGASAYPREIPHEKFAEIAKEVGAEGIRVNGVRPGIIRTEIHVASGDPARVDRIGATAPLGRAGDPEEVARLIVWLASDAASYMSGALIDVSGGR